MGADLNLIFWFQQFIGLATELVDEMLSTEVKQEGMVRAVLGAQVPQETGNATFAPCNYQIGRRCDVSWFHIRIHMVF